MSMFKLQGRVGRLTFFWHSVFDTVFLAVMVTLVIAAQQFLGIETNPVAFFLAVAFIVVVGAIAQFCATVRRCHDIGWSGWMILLTFIPVVNLVISLILFFKPGDPGDNEYGRSPKAY